MTTFAKRNLSILALLIATTTMQLSAQPHMSATIQTNHLWRGGEVADGIVVVGDAYVTTLNEALQIGVWGGMNVQGTYKEFNYVVAYTHDHFKLSLSDTYNFADYATYNNEEFFNYSPSTTGRFIDATLTYTLSDSFPLRLLWATVLYGRDRNDANSENIYSTYCSVEYPLYDKYLWKVGIEIGGAFSLRPTVGEQGNFYGSKPSVVEVMLSISREVRIRDYKLPISVSTMWNPDSNSGFFQLSAQVLSF